jgi:hypothetical protein
MQSRWNHATSTARPTPRLTHRGAGRQGNIFFLRSRENNALDIPSPKTLSSVNLRDLESELGGSFSE